LAASDFRDTPSIDTEPSRDIVLSITPREHSLCDRSIGFG
jgi:hypothetical protein